MSDPWTEAWAEAETSVPASVIQYHTLELRHPAFGATTAIRVVQGVGEDMYFTLEDGAPLDGGESVLFQAVPIQVEMPEFAEGQTPECKITIDNVGRELMPYLEEGVRMRADLECSFRQYRSDMIEDGPVYGPVTFLIKRVKVNRTSVTGVARIDDLANRKFPSKVYTLQEFPGLRA